MEPRYFTVSYFLFVIRYFKVGMESGWQLMPLDFVI